MQKCIGETRMAVEYSVVRRGMKNRIQHNSRNKRKRPKLLHGERYIPESSRRILRAVVTSNITLHSGARTEERKTMRQMSALLRLRTARI